MKELTDIPPVLLAIRPKFARAILEGHKRIELRHTAPKGATPGNTFTAFIYECGPGSRHGVVGAVRVRGVSDLRPEDYADAATDACLDVMSVRRYGYGKTLKQWHIDSYYMREFGPICILDGPVPQSWRYLTQVERGIYEGMVDF